MVLSSWRRFFGASSMFLVLALGFFAYWRWFYNTESKQQIHPIKQYTIQKGALFSDDDVPTLSALNHEMSIISARASQSLVTISAVGSTLSNRMNYNGHGASRIVSRKQGSGVIVSSEGHIITNFHVIDGQSYIQVVLDDGTVETARLVGSDNMLDIAVLKIDVKEPLKPIPFGDSDQVQTGNFVMALGTPYGWTKTVTQGIVSGRDRQMGSLGVNYIQTDATIHQGNSGGPLINIYGEMIGINSSVLAAGRTASGTLGFAIPSNLVLQAFKQICEHGRPMRGYLGIDFIEPTPRIRELIHYVEDKGAIINLVRYNSPAERSGLKVGDVVLECNKSEISNRTELLRKLETLQGGDVIKFVVWRQGKKVNINITLDDMAKEVEHNMTSLLASHGIRARNLTLEELSFNINGVYIEKVNTSNISTGTVYEDMGIRTGDLIVGVDNQRIYSLKELNEKLKRPVILNLIRGNRLFRIRVDMTRSVVTSAESGFNNV